MNHFIIVSQINTYHLVKQLRFNMPKSTTNKLSVGMQYSPSNNSNENGLILEIEKIKILF